MTTTLFRTPVRPSISERWDGLSVSTSRPATTASPSREPCDVRIRNRMSLSPFIFFASACNVVASVSTVALGEPAPDPRRMQSEVRTAASPIVTYFMEPAIDLGDNRPQRKPAAVDVWRARRSAETRGPGRCTGRWAALHHATPRCAEDHPTYFAPPMPGAGARHAAMLGQWFESKV